MNYKREVEIQDLLVWVYGRQKADIVIDRGVGLHALEREADGIMVYGVSGDGCVQVLRNAEMGASVRGSMQCSQLHPDAETVHELVRSLHKRGLFNYLEVGLIIQQGQLACAPDWMPGKKPIISPKLNPKGRPVMIYDDNRHPIACAVKVDVSLACIEYARMLYETWVIALEKLHQILISPSSNLTTYSLLPFSLDPQPWAQRP